MGDSSKNLILSKTNFLPCLELIAAAHVLTMLSNGEAEEELDKHFYFVSHATNVQQ